VFQCYKLHWTAQEGQQLEGEPVGLTCETPEQESFAPNPDQPCGIEQSQERERNLTAARKWLEAEGFLEDGPHMQEDLRDNYYLYLVHVGRILPEGFAVPGCEPEIYESD